MTAAPQWPESLATMRAWLAGRGIGPGQQVDPHTLGLATMQWHEKRQRWATEHGLRIRSDGALIREPLLDHLLPPP